MIFALLSWSGFSQAELHSEVKFSCVESDVKARESHGKIEAQVQIQRGFWRKEDGSELIRVLANVVVNGEAAQPLLEQCRQERYRYRCPSELNGQRFEIYPVVDLNDDSLSEVGVVIWPQNGRPAEVRLKSCTQIPLT